MNRNRKAQIQRRLTLSAVPKPPDGLADRIKRDIPNYLQAADVERERFSRSIAFNMRVAASILLLVTSVFVTINLLVPDEPSMKSSATVDAVAASQRGAGLPKADATSTAAVDELRVEIHAEQQPLAEVAQTNTDKTTTAIRRDEGIRESARPSEVAAASPVMQMAKVEVAPPPSAMPPADPAPQTEPDRMTITANAPAVRAEAAPRAAAPTLVREAIASDLALGPKQSVFGISVDPQAFERIRSTIEKGSRPAASAINVEALVNYFAGAPSRVRGDARLEAEGSPVPVGVNGHSGILRFTVDTRSAAGDRPASIPPVGTNARVDIVFNRNAVAGYKRIGDTDAIASEATLLGNTSVTGLYAIDLKPGAGKRTRIATVTLRYKSVADGKEKSRFAVVYGADFARTWTLASRRHRLASLGAVWGESLKGSGTGPDVAVKAEELATQAPNDAKAKELAAAASASSGGGQ